MVIKTNNIDSCNYSTTPLRLLNNAHACGTNIGWIESWSKRKGLGADLVRKYEDSEAKICLPKVRSLARPVLALAWPCHPLESLLLLLLRF
ncbi:hypothetical protein MTR_3g048817 [Medicago truncatula]|uniref:Uncharacterized protein n=1 Tax=Medicago truncatula TaxID=3880 RepID=A0A072UVR2_MEDTR|nr:hypothetical protein MTR_3g048817 [Medicago truncatula]